MSEAEGKAPGRVVAGRYRLESVLGRGGMGVVWRAVDTLIERTVALKELRAPTAVTEGDRSSFVERALREARSAGRLNHPGVVAVHDVIAPSGDDDAVYIVMEYVQAPSLAELVDQHGPLPAHRVAALGLGILDGLDAAHAIGIVHRDVKPSNVLVRDGDRVKLTDFGIALAPEDTRLTRSGVIGTQAYLAPERFDAGQVGPSADLWALGATLFHAVAGRAPFDRATTTATLRAILFEDPPPPPCSPALAEVITGLLTRPVEHRLTSDVARQKLRHVAAEPASPPPADPASTGGAGRAAWEVQATSLHRPPATPPPPYGTTQPPPPAPPAPAAPTPGRPAGGSWAGPPPRRNHTPLIIGGVVAAAVLLIVVIAARGGGSDPDGGGATPVTTGAVPGVPDPGATGSDPASEAAEGEAVALAFLDAVNGGDESTAIGMLCPDSASTYTSNITTAIAGNVSALIEERVVDSHLNFTATLAGTVNDEPLSYATITVTNDSDTGWCVLIFSAL